MMLKAMLPRLSDSVHDGLRYSLGAGLFRQQRAEVPQVTGRDSLQLFVRHRVQSGELGTSNKHAEDGNSEGLRPL